MISDTSLNAAPGGDSDADPSMEDILASIRRILNDGDAAEPAEPETAPASADDDVFLLDASMIVAETPAPAPAAVEDSKPAAVVPKIVEPELEPDIPPPPAWEAETLLAPETETAAAAAIGELAAALQSRAMPLHRGNSPTLEDMVRDELRPMLKTWLDAYLPELVERLVQAEIERVVRRR